mgnify:CR=1 FL=1
MNYNQYLQNSKNEKIKLLFDKTFKTPVLFLIFNRPDTTKKVFSSIREAKPPRLYIAADGPRKNNLNDKKNCMIVRSIASKVDWDCDVKTLFINQNLGCRLAVSQGINWFFEHEPEGIILEDDCLPSQSFFIFCQQMLEQFRNDKRIGAVCGFYSNEKDYKPKSSYFISRYLRVWGWAGWRRTIKNYDSNLKKMIKKNDNWQDNIFERSDILLKKYFQKAFDQVADGKIDTWDTQLQYLLWQKKQNVVISSNNLIKNLGADGAHAKTKDHNHELPISEIEFPLIGPENLKRDTNADKQIELKSYKISKLSFLKNQLKKIVS